MDEQLQSTVLYKSRGFSGRLSEGFKFLEKNFKQIFKISIIGLLPVSMLSALTMVFNKNLNQKYKKNKKKKKPVSFLSALTMVFLPVHLLDGMMVVVWFLLMIVFALLASLYFDSFIFSMLEKYGEVGFVPVMKLKGWWPLMKTKLTRVLLCDVVVGIFMAISLLIIFMPYIAGLSLTEPAAESAAVSSSLPVWSVVMTILLAIVFIVAWIPLALMPNFYLLGNRSLMGSFVRSFKLGFPHWGAMFGMVLFALIMFAITELFGGLPYFITQMMDYLIALAAEDGNVAVLPFYYVILKIVLALIMVLVSSYASLFIVVPLAFQYASLVTMEKEKKAELEANQSI